jgi:LuxR family transcriptional regulator, maltose regulon positive regulatory protein
MVSEMAAVVEDRVRAGRASSAHPQVAQSLVRRGALFERLSAAEPGGVVLVCAPAGSGKTVLLRSWVDAAGLQDQLAWVSVRRGERDAQRFWISLIDAITGVADGVERVDPAPSFRGEAVVEQLLVDLECPEKQPVLIIDDLHEIDSPDALSWLELFIARLPPGLSVVLASREDPRLGLHRLRLTGKLTELRGPDLRFSLEEAKELLLTAGVTLSDGALDLLHERTEGWAAGLRLAAVSLARHPDPERFVTEFSGAERTVAGYLVAEVLERQPAEVRELLLRTSLLDRVSGPLADHLTGSSGSERIFQELEDANAFVTSLDAGRSWFRYHHLFADLLQLELRRAAPTIIRPLHRAAAEWYEQEGYSVEGIRHAQAARDWPDASRMLVDNYLDLSLDGRIATVRELLDAFPDQVAAADPELRLVVATARLLDGAYEESGADVEQAQRLAAAVPAERRRGFGVRLAEMRLVRARWRGDLESVLEAKQAMEAALAAQPASERVLGDAHRSIALQNLGVAELWAGRFVEARRHLVQALALARHAGRAWLELPCLGHLGIAGPWTGLPLSAGLERGEEAVRIADTHGWGEDPALVTGLATSALVLLWLGRLDEAESWLGRAQRVLQPDGEPGTELIVHHARGLLRLAQERFEEAAEAFGQARRMQTLLTETHPFTMRTRARLIQTYAGMGQASDARAELADVSAEERLTSELRVAAAVVHLANHEPGEAVDGLVPVIEGVAPTIHRATAAAEAQVLDAVAREQLGDPRAAEASMEQALELAEPEGIVLPFILARTHGILERLPRHRTAHATLRQTILDILVGSAAAVCGKSAPLLDELSEAEVRVMRYLPTNLRAPEIATELFVSTNTIRTHQRHIYVKLGVHGRAEAVARARELGLLAPATRPR